MGHNLKKKKKLKKLLKKQKLFFQYTYIEKIRFYEDINKIRQWTQRSEDS